MLPVLGGILPLERAANRLDLRCRLRYRHAWPKRPRTSTVGTSRRRRYDESGGAGSKESTRRSQPGWSREGGGRHAGDHERLAVDPHGPSDDGGILLETARPECVTEHDGPVAILIGPHPTGRGSHAQHAEVAQGHRVRVDALRALAGRREAHGFAIGSHPYTSTSVVARARRST